MVNAWSLAGSIMNGTFEEDYPLMDKKLYIYESPDGGKTVTRREPFSDKREVIQGDYFEEITWSDVEDKRDKDLDWIAKSGGFEWTPGSPWPPEVPDEEACNGDDYFGDDGRDVFYDVVNVESTLNYLKNIRNTKRKLWDAEEERDAIDQQRQSYQYSVISNAKRISADRKQQEGYYKVMQGAYMRALLLQSAHTKQSTMIWDVLNALRRRKSATKAIEESITKLKAQVSSSKPRGKATSLKNGTIKSV